MDLFLGAILPIQMLKYNTELCSMIANTQESKTRRQSEMPFRKLEKKIASKVWKAHLKQEPLKIQFVENDTVEKHSEEFLLSQIIHIYQKKHCHTNIKNRSHV